jgi:ketosteroid isomerase-like protein
MSEENVELTLLAIDAWNRRDAEAAAALMDPEGVWYPALEVLTGEGTYRGPAGVREGFENLAEFSEESYVEFPEVHDLGDQVLGLGHGWFRFASGVELDQENAALFTWRDGKCVEVRQWFSHAEALEAAGLEEQAMSQNVEIVRQLFEHWEQGDWRGGRDLMVDNCEFVFSTSWFPDAGVYSVGPEAVDAWIAFTEAFEELATGADQIIEADEGVVALAWLRGRGRASGAGVDAKVGAIFTLRDGKIIRCELADRRKALEAAGLRE